MKLITKAIENKLKKFPLYSQDGKGDEAEIIVKFFNPCGSGTWWVLEGDQLEDGDWEFYGIAEITDREYGYFRLSELTSLKLPFGMKIERDMHFDNKKVKDI